LSHERHGASSAQLLDDHHYNLPARRLEARDSCRVLLVDDDALVRARLSALLNASQYQVETAATGEEAVRVLDATHCHIVLTDWQMPDMDGLALCRHIRLRHRESYIYVLMLTIRDSEHDVMKGLAAGADAYLVKGATINDFLARLEIGRRITRESSPVPGSHRDYRSFMDTVAGTHNLGYLLHHLPRELARSQRYGHPLAILHCAIDGFNRFNDRFGAEFMIVLPETTAKGAHCAAHKLRQIFAQHPLSIPSAPIGFTVSITVTAVDAKHDSQSTAQVEAALRVANRGMYDSDHDRANSDALACTNGFGAQIGGTNGLN
jgi:two-component system, cell cycle response regulator